MKTRNNKFLELWGYISQEKKTKFYGIIILMILASFAEVMAIGSVVPFLAALTNPELILDNQYIQPLLRSFSILEESQVILPLTLIFIFAAFLSAILRLILLRSYTQIAFSTGAELNTKIMQITLSKDYDFHTRTNSSEIISGITNKTQMVTFNVILPILTILSSCFMLLFIFSTLIYINKEITIISIVSFTAAYLILFKYVNLQLDNAGLTISDKTTQVVKIVQESLGSIRDVILHKLQGSFIHTYSNAENSLNSSRAKIQFLAIFPRYVLEAFGITLIASFALYFFYSDQGVASAIPTLGAFALGSQRLLPVIQNLYAGLANIKAGHAALEDVLMLFRNANNDIAIEDTTYFEFNNKIEIKDVSFFYEASSEPTLDQINCIISKGSRIGLIGSTGSGKSTFLDLFMGLLKPQTGKILVDQKDILDNLGGWQANISHVPQKIFLVDDSIAKNISFGVSEVLIDFDKLDKAIKASHLSDFIDSLPAGLETVIGEDGARLSGGQRQRLGIARALYRESELIVFDEATSALDSTTEESIMDSIYSLNPDITILIVSHRKESLSRCSGIIEFDQGKIRYLDKS